MSDVGKEKSSEREPAGGQRSDAATLFRNATEQYLQEAREKVQDTYNQQLGNKIPEIKDAVIKSAINTLEAARKLQASAGVPDANTGESSSLFETARRDGVRHYNNTIESVPPDIVQQKLAEIINPDMTPGVRPEKTITTSVESAVLIAERQFIIAAEAAAARLQEEVNRELNKLQTHDGTGGPPPETTEALQKAIAEQQKLGGEAIDAWSQNEPVWLGIREKLGVLETWEKPKPLENGVERVLSGLNSVAEEASTLIEASRKASSIIDEKGPLRDVVRGIETTKLTAERTHAWATSNSALFENFASTPEASVQIHESSQTLYQQALSIADQARGDWHQIARLDKSINIENQQIGTDQERSQIKEVSNAIYNLRSPIGGVADSASELMAANDNTQV